MHPRQMHPHHREHHAPTPPSGRHAPTSVRMRSKTLQTDSDSRRVCTLYWCLFITGPLTSAILATKGADRGIHFLRTCSGAPPLISHGGPKVCNHMDWVCTHVNSRMPLHDPRYAPTWREYATTWLEVCTDVNLDHAIANFLQKTDIRSCATFTLVP